MKNLSFILLILMSVAMLSQAPALIPYQAVARDAGGQPLANASLTARFTIRDLTATGAGVWQELQSVSTSPLGLFTVQLGSVTPLTNVDWGNGAKFMQVEINAGNGFVDIGTQQMLSVPYALHSSEAQNGYSHVSYSGDTLFFENGSFVIIPGISLANGGVLLGCTNSVACNYSSAATLDDGSCVNPGCNDPEACNYDASAGCDNGSCYYAGSNCDDNNAATYNDVYDASCVCAGGVGVMEIVHSCGAQNVHNGNLIYGSMTDQEGNVYKTIVIGAQEWMAENLSTSIYRNGDSILSGLTNAEWNNTSYTQQAACAYYNNDSSYSCPYGKLYNWYALIDSRQLCPIGWHVPSDAEWSTMINFLDPTSDASNNYNSDNAGAAMKTVGTIESGIGYWSAYDPSVEGTNSSGFSGLPGGFRYLNGAYNGIGVNAIWWSSTQDGTYLAWGRMLRSDITNIYRGQYNTRYGLSVRCLKD